MQDNGYVDGQGRTIKDFNPTYWDEARDVLDRFLNNPPPAKDGSSNMGLELEVENAFAEAIRGVLVEDAGVDPALIKDMSLDSLRELSGYISDILTEEQIDSVPASKQDLSSYDDYYNDGTQSDTDFSAELDQLEQWVKDQNVNPAEWFDRLGIKPEDSTAFANTYQ